MVVEEKERLALAGVNSGREDDSWCVSWMSVVVLAPRVMTTTAGPGPKPKAGGRLGGKMFCVGDVSNVVREDG